jgi:hypothetical protein
MVKVWVIQALVSASHQRPSILDGYRMPGVVDNAENDGAGYAETN